MKMERKYVSIWFPWLITDWICTRRSECKNLPLVVSAMSHGKDVIIHVNRIAFLQGIHTGMVLADARAIYPRLNVMKDRAGLQEKLLKKIAEWCIRFTPSASMDAPDGLMLDVSGCTHLWGGDQDYLDDLTSKLASKGFSTKIAMAPTPGAAYGFARYQTSKQIIPANELLTSILSLPPEALRLEAETIAMLYKLGLRKLQDFIAMPRTVLMNRFGKQLNLRILQMTGRADEILHPVIPVENIQERLPCPEPILTRKGIEIALENTLSRLVDRLQKQGLGIRKSVFRIYKYDSHCQEISISTHRASANFSHLLKLFVMRIEELDPGPGIELFTLECTHAEKNPPLQEGFWEAAGSLESTELSELMDKIRTRTGEDSIARYLPAEHHWPDRSIKKAGSLDERPSIPWCENSRRPVELVNKPERIEVAAPIPDYPPMLFRHRGNLHRVKKADGPERIEREWWLEKGEHRDYYSLEDEEGKRYWVFRSGHYSEERNGQWFLCGYFA